MVTSRSGNASGLVLFNKARDAVLAKHGIAGFQGLTAATRRAYPRYPQTFEGWNQARDAVLVKSGLRGGYAGLMKAAKAEYDKTGKTQLTRSPRIVDPYRGIPHQAPPRFPREVELARRQAQLSAARRGK
jgi:hypothetical protein